MKIQTFINEFKLTFVYDLLRQTLTDDQLFEHSVENGQVIWFKEQMRQMWLMWEKAKAPAVLEGFVLVKADNVDSFYQDDNEPENFCRSCDDLDALGDCIDRDEIMIVNKHTSAHISTEKFYGAWGVIETSYGTAWKFKLFNTEGEAKAAMIEAQEPAND